jgi:hypothetical protein
MREDQVHCDILTRKFLSNCELANDRVAVDLIDAHPISRAVWTTEPLDEVLAVAAPCSYVHDHIGLLFMLLHDIPRESDLGGEACEKVAARPPIISKSYRCVLQVGLLSLGFAPQFDLSRKESFSKWNNVYELHPV